MLQILTSRDLQTSAVRLPAVRAATNKRFERASFKEEAKAKHLVSEIYRLRLSTDVRVVLLELYGGTVQPIVNRLFAIDLKKSRSCDRSYAGTVAAADDMSETSSNR